MMPWKYFFIYPLSLEYIYQWAVGWSWRASLLSSLRSSARVGVSVTLALCWFYVSKIKRQKPQIQNHTNHFHLWNHTHFSSNKFKIKITSTNTYTLYSTEESHYYSHLRKSLRSTYEKEFKNAPFSEFESKKDYLGGVYCVECVPSFLLDVASWREKDRVWADYYAYEREMHQLNGYLTLQARPLDSWTMAMVK